MYFTDMSDVLGKVSDSNMNATTDMIHNSLDTMNKTNPLLFNSEFVDHWKSLMDKSSNCISEHMELYQNMFRLYHYTTMRSFGFNRIIGQDALVHPPLGSRECVAHQ